MASPQILPYVTEAAYAAWAGAPQGVLYEAEVVAGGAPIAFPQAEADFYDLAPLRYDFPAVTLTTLRDVVVRGGANTLNPPEALVRHGLSDPDGDILPEDFYARLMILEGGAATWTLGDPFEVDYLPQAAVFTDGVAANYAHWMTEVLPRIAAFAGDPEHAAIPLVVDADLHPNLLRSISIVAGPDAPIYQLGPERALRVGVLHNVSPTGYVPFKLRAQSLEAICHGLFGGQALRASVEALRRGVGAPRGSTRPKLFLRRRSTLRHIVNEAEIQEALTKLGFEALDPDALTLDEQVAAYSNAGMVVGATGAAMANLVFCAPDCPTVVLMPKFRETAYWYWRRMGAAAGAGPVVHVSGPQSQVTDDPFHPLAVHQDFGVDVRDVLDAVEAAEALRR